MINFNEYKGKVYNPGSPDPNPSESRLPPRSESFSGQLDPPLRAKLNARMTNNATIKRGPSLRPQSEAGTSPDGKKHRFDKDMLKSIGKELLEELLPKFQEMVDGAAKRMEEKLDEKLGEKIGELEQKMKSLEASQSDLTERVINLEQRPITNDVDYDRVREEVLPSVTESLSGTIDAQWQNFLSEEIRKKENVLVIHGLKNKNISQPHGFEDFCQHALLMPHGVFANLHIYDVSIISGMSRGRDGMEYVAFVTLENVNERNQFFKYGKNLPKHISLDKSIPKCYMSKYKDLLSKGWKLRTTEDVLTRIDFDGAYLSLRYKKKDENETKYSWTIAESFCPKPDPPCSNAKYTPSEGSVPTPVIPPGKHESVVLLPFSEKLSLVELENSMTDFFSEEDRKKIVYFDEA